MKPITVLLVDDHQLVREAFRSLLKDETDIEVVGEAETGRQAVALAKKLRPAVVVMDIAMPELNGLEAMRLIRKDVPAIRVLILSSYNDDAYVKRMAELGGAGFLLKQNSSNILAQAIREVQSGNTFLSPSIRKRPSDRRQMSIAREGVNKQESSRLSSREVEVLQLIAEGKINKQIAKALGVSFKTVDKHRQHLMAKLNIHDIAGLTRYSIRAGIIKLQVQDTCPIPRQF